MVKKKLEWKKNIILNNDKGHNIGGGLAADENYLFIGSPYEEILCLELNTGKIIWKNSTLTPVRATPTLVDNKVIILTLDNRTLVFEKEDGSLIWEHQEYKILHLLLENQRLQSKETCISAVFKWRYFCP